MANEVNTHSTASVAATTKQKVPETLNTKCSVCCITLKTVQECLKHELLVHSLQKKTAAKTGGGIESRIKATDKFLNTKEKQEERLNVQKALATCRKGQELKTILKLLSMNSDFLNLIFTRIQTCLAKELGRLGVVRIYPFGSIASSLALRDSDIDVFVDASQVPARDLGQTPKNNRIVNAEAKQTSQTRGAFNRINAVLQRSPLFVDVFAIRGARVPIIKCKHRDTGFSVDINISCHSSIENTQFICELVKSDGRIHELFLFVKLWAKNMQIIGRANMTSYCLITMIIFYLQHEAILKSIQALQKGCPSRMVQGVNYAFNLQSKENKPSIAQGKTTMDLIRGFFQFYKSYNFEDNIISPFYGKTIAKENFTEESFTDYSKQLLTIGESEGIAAEAVQLDRCMCVQDSFVLNHNVARSMLPPNKKYFVMCVENAATLCENLNKKSGEILEKLLYETIFKTTPVIEKGGITVDLNHMGRTPASANSNGNNETSKTLNHFIEPSKADLKSIATANPDITEPNAILRFWCDHYVSVIEKILCEFYGMDVQTKETPQKQQRMDNEELNHSWEIVASVDLWSNRYFQKTPHQTYWEYQMAQTERLLALRRQDSNFAVQLSAILCLKIESDYMGLTVSVGLPDGSPVSTLTKKDPLRKFFNVFRNTLQNYCLREVLLVDKPLDKPKT
ncbi:monkey king protein [Haematobia irritans]|uniref:monkey king protein n=1 Tax=Haematobia irritans TaxID=7368 RepID=UPI003F4FBE6C